jgi:competence ComEA-like helix-hairpin-helix protein
VPNFLDNNIALAADKVNINTANATELDTIPEVGPATAAKIIAYRETIGPFLVIEDIMKVSGIKQASFDKMKDFITVENGSSGGVTGGGAGTTTATSTDSGGGTATTTTATTTTIVNTIYSVHYIQEDLSSYSEPTTFEISAGRDRLGYVDSPVNFVAKYKVSGDLQNNKCGYIWNFGDGIAEPGEKVEHIYKYVGDYNVILNGTCDSWQAVSRTTVRIVEAKISIKEKEGGAIEIFNQGDYEVNLFNWKISAGDYNYVFPMDTIISANKAVTFPAEYLKIPTTINEVVLTDVFSKEKGRAGSKLSVLNIKDSDRIVTVADFEKFAVEYKRLNQVDNKIAVNTVSPYTQIATSSTDSNIILSASVADLVINGDGSSFGFWSKLFHPVRTIKDTFYK